ncbi:MAG TPA: tetratricopeptide repeat protein [Candidatus Acidoferrum sp.]|nr:tetratricopeptide repeat protein [Candidatus Acidoferrum sp.]
MPLSVGAIVKLYASSGGIHLTQSTQDNATARFAHIRGDEYDIEVSALGYKTTTEHASVVSGSTSFTLYIYLHLENESAESGAGAKGIVMTPRLQEQIDKGLDKLRRKQFEEATKQFLKAAKMAPGNPDVDYLLGMVEYLQEHWEAARARFQAALALYPSHERSLLALGELQLRTGDPAGAAQTLEKVYLVNGADWRTHLLLANAYEQQKRYDQALPHALKVVELAKEEAAPGWLLLGEIYLAQQKRDGAKHAFETVLRSFPKDAAAREARSQLVAMNAAMDERPAAAPMSNVQPVAMTLAPLPVIVRRWAPPDIDSKEYPAVQDVPCSEGELIARTQRRTRMQLGNFEKFLATEHIEHQEVDANGIPGTPHERDFTYLVFLQHPKPGLTFLEESRDGGVGTDSFPTFLATTGLVALGVNVFDPDYGKDLTYKCEGLGTWRGRATWRLRFEQRRDAPSQLRLWRNARGTYHIPLKGRVWIDAASYDVLHVETDLRDPVKELQLTRDHLIVDYGPVKFDHNGVSLWLPWNAEMFLEFRGKRYHHTHALRNYMLFSVDTNGTVSKPKETLEQNDEQR